MHALELDAFPLDDILNATVNSVGGGIQKTDYRVLTLFDQAVQLDHQTYDEKLESPVMYG